MLDTDIAVLERTARPIHEQQYTDRTADVPAEAMLFAAELNLGDNGDDAKSVPVRILARTRGECFHWYWGRVVHDLDGMIVHKKRIPVDYEHNTFDAMGYINHFTVEEEGLVLSGALVPFKNAMNTDRAAEVVHKARNGVPYEASVGSSWDGLVIEEVPGGASVEANGLTFVGPIIIFRKWHLRGVAICLYGADMNTASEFTRSQGRENNSTVPVTFTSTTGKAQEKTKMADETKPAESPKGVEAEEKAAESTEGVEADDQKAAESPKGVEAEEKAAESTEGVEAGKGEAAGDMSAGRTECKRFIAAFGERGGQWFAEGKTFDQAQELNVAELKAENVKLKGRLAAAGEGEAEPVAFQPGESGDGGKSGDGKPGNLAGQIGEGLARFAAGLKLPQNANKEK